MSCNICNTSDEQAEWRPVVGWEDEYLVSSDGRVYGIKRKRLLTPAIDRLGYAQLGLSKNWVRTNVNVHRLQAVAWFGDEPKLQVNHKDGIKSHNCILNLEWITAAQNIQHAWTTGLTRSNRKVWATAFKQGSKHCNAKLTEASVLEIRKRWRETKDHSLAFRETLASEYKVSESSIKSVVYKYAWRHI